MTFAILVLIGYQALAQAQSTLKSVRSLLEQRESDLAAVQTALRDLESEKRKLGESHTTDRFSLELELDRLKRDLARCEDELARTRDDLRDKEQVRRDRDAAIDRLVSVLSCACVLLVIGHCSTLRSVACRVSLDPRLRHGLTSARSWISSKPYVSRNRYPRRPLLIVVADSKAGRT